jgi:hypothetical protein
VTVPPNRPPDDVWGPDLRRVVSTSEDATVACDLGHPLGDQPVDQVGQALGVAPGAGVGAAGAAVVQAASAGRAGR